MEKGVRGAKIETRGMAFVSLLDRHSFTSLLLHMPLKTHACYAVCRLVLRPDQTVTTLATFVVTMPGLTATTTSKHFKNKINVVTIFL